MFNSYAFWEEYQARDFNMESVINKGGVLIDHDFDIAILDGDYCLDDGIQYYVIGTVEEFYETILEVERDTNNKLFL